MHPKIAARRIEAELNSTNYSDVELARSLDQIQDSLLFIKKKYGDTMPFRKELEFCQNAKCLLKTTEFETVVGKRTRAYILVGLSEMRDVLHAIAIASEARSPAPEPGNFEEPYILAAS